MIFLLNTLAGPKIKEQIGTSPFISTYASTEYGSTALLMLRPNKVAIIIRGIDSLLKFWRDEEKPVPVVLARRTYHYLFRLSKACVY